MDSNRQIPLFYPLDIGLSFLSNFSSMVNANSVLIPIHCRPLDTMYHHPNIQDAVHSFVLEIL